MEHYELPSDKTSIQDVVDHYKHVIKHREYLDRYMYVSLALITKLRDENVIDEETAQDLHGLEDRKQNVKAVFHLMSKICRYICWKQYKQFCRVLWNPIQQRMILKFLIPDNLHRNKDYLKSVFGPDSKIEMIPVDLPEVAVQLYRTPPMLQYCSQCDRKLTDAATTAAVEKNNINTYIKDLVAKLQLFTNWPADIDYRVEMSASKDGIKVFVKCPTGKFMDKMMKASEEGDLTECFQEIVQKNEDSREVHDLTKIKVEIEVTNATNARMAMTESGFQKLSKSHLEDLSKMLKSTTVEKFLENLKENNLILNVTEDADLEEVLGILAEQPDSVFYKIMSALHPSDDKPKYSDIVTHDGVVQMKKLDRVLLKPFGGREWPPKDLNRSNANWTKNIIVVRGMTSMPSRVAVVHEYQNIMRLETFWEETGDTTGCTYECHQSANTYGIAFHPQLNVLLFLVKDGRYVACHHLEPSSLKLFRKVDFEEKLHYPDLTMTVLSNGDIAVGYMTDAVKAAIDIREADSDWKLIRQILLTEEESHKIQDITEISPGLIAIARRASETPGLSLYKIQNGEHFKDIFQDYGNVYGLCTDKEGFTWAGTVTPQSSWSVCVISPDLQVVAQYRMKGDLAAVGDNAVWILDSLSNLKSQIRCYNI